MRAARVAGVLWVFYLPLAFYTHVLWNETLFLACFLPSLYLILTVLQSPLRRTRYSEPDVHTGFF